MIDDPAVEVTSQAESCGDDPCADRPTPSPEFGNELTTEGRLDMAAG